jgi:hypothetical protein
MGKTQIIGLICAVITIGFMFELIRRQSIKEKYTVLWVLAAIAIVTIAVYPQILDDIADLTGIQDGPNVVLAVGGLAITIVGVQLSIEVSRLEDRSRALAEEIGLLRLEALKQRGEN